MVLNQATGSLIQAWGNSLGVITKTPGTVSAAKKLPCSECHFPVRRLYASRIHQFDGMSVF